MQESESVPVQLPEEEARLILQESQVIGGRRVPQGSNYTFLVHMDSGPGTYLRAIYKPRDGERPLYDYPMGTLYKREYAAFVLSRALGWPDIPLTVIRDGPHGVGAFQLYVEYDPAITYFDLVDDRADVLQRFAAFDLLANNGDRKGGHCILGQDGTIWSIDHGLTFHQLFNLRTVMLEFWGKPIPRPLLDDMESLVPKLDAGGSLRADLDEVLTGREIDALVGRLEGILKNPVHPMLDPYVNVPWPAT